MSDERVYIYIYLSINDIRLQIRSFLQGQYVLSLEVNENILIYSSGILIR